MRIAWNNLIKDNSSISATNENANYPVEGLYTRWKKEIFKATGTGSVITISWAADQTISCVGFAYHNLSSMSVVLKNSAGTTLATWTPAVTNQTDVDYETELTTVRSVEITLASASTLFLGALFLGTYIDSNKTVGQDLPKSSTAKLTKSLGGQIAGRDGVTLRRARITAPDVSNTQRLQFEALYDDMKEIEPFWLDLWQESHTEFTPVFGHLKSAIRIMKDKHSNFTITLDFEEAN